MIREKITEMLFSTERDGIEKLIEFLDNSDFYTAPASTRFHNDFKGGLVEHSLNVYNCLIEISMMNTFPDDFDVDSIIICSLLHDLCKVNFYKETTRNVKNEITGSWEKQPYYTVEDNEPYGHGEKSVMIAEYFIKLRHSEKYAIRWHMGGFDDAAKGGSYSVGKAFDKFPLVTALHMADLMATHICEVKND